MPNSPFLLLKHMATQKESHSSIHNSLRATVIKCAFYFPRLSKESEIFRSNNSEMPRMFRHDSPKFEGCPTGYRYSFNIRQNTVLHAVRNWVSLAASAVSNFSRTLRLACNIRVPYTRPADAHVHATEARPGCIVPACSTTTAAAALWKIWVIRKRSQGSCRGEFSRFVALKNHTGGSESERRRRSRNVSFRKIYTDPRIGTKEIRVNGRVA